MAERKGASRMTHEQETENFIGHLYDEDGDSECYECGGEGWIVDDCFEDTCCCADPECEHDVIPCPNCNPRGEL